MQIQVTSETRPGRHDACGKFLHPAEARDLVSVRWDVCPTSERTVNGVSEVMIRIAVVAVRNFHYEHPEGERLTETVRDGPSALENSE